MSVQEEISYLTKQKARLLQELGTLPYNNPYNEEIQYELQHIQYNLEVLQGKRT